jgi:hypothetical protein
MPLGLQGNGASTRGSSADFGAGVSPGGPSAASVASAPNPLYVPQRGRSAADQDAASAVATNPMRSSSSANATSAVAATGSGDDRASSSGGKRRRGVKEGKSGKEGDSDDDSSAGEERGPPVPGREWLHHGPYTGAETVSRSVTSDLFQGLLCSRVRCR